MKKMVKIVVSGILSGMFILIALGSAGPKSITYDIDLSEVEAPVDARDPYGETKVVKFADNDSSITTYTYEDDYIHITWFVSSYYFEFALRNKSQYTLKINWADISYVDYNGQVENVCLKNQIQPYALIPKDGTLMDRILPSIQMHWTSQTFSWTKDVFLPNAYSSHVEPESVAAKYIGKSMAILMPISIEDVQNDYIFTFDIKGFATPKSTL